MMDHLPHSPSPLSSSYKPFIPTQVAPLNIISRSCSSATVTSTPSPTDPVISPRSLLEDNVQYLCEMVDTVLGQSSHDNTCKSDSNSDSNNNNNIDNESDNCHSGYSSQCSSTLSSPTTTRSRSRTSSSSSRNKAQLCIRVSGCDPSKILFSNTARGSDSIDDYYQAPPLHPLALSPRTFDLAKSDLTKVDERIVSRMNNDTLLTLFPEPPQQRTQNPLEQQQQQQQQQPQEQQQEKQEQHSQQEHRRTDSCNGLPSHSGLTIRTDLSTIVPSLDNADAMTSAESRTIDTNNSAGCNNEHKHNSDGDDNGAAQAKAKLRKQRLALKRNWVIPPGSHVVLPTMETCNLAASSSSPSPSPSSSSSSSPSLPFDYPKTTVESFQEQGATLASFMPYHANVSSISLPDSTVTKTLLDFDSVSLSESIISTTSSTASLPLSTRSLNTLDSLSHRLWAFEMQMRRASFLVNDRASVLSRIVPSSSPSSRDASSNDENHSSQPAGGASANVPPLRFMAGKQTSSSNIDNEDTSSESSQSPVDDAEMERGWIAWQEEWARTMGRGRLPGFTRTMSLSESEKQDRDEGGDSEEETVFSSIRSSHSSVVTAVSESSGCGSRHPSGGYSKTGKPPVSGMFLSPHSLHHSNKWQQTMSSMSSSSSRSKWSSSLSTSSCSSSSSLCSPRTPTTPHSIKDADPALWETEHGQKWSDRFQFLVHNFQAAAGKHTRRLADIIPKGSRRWTKKSRARSIPTEAVQMTPSSGEVV